MKIAVTVKPGSKKGPLVEEVSDGLMVYVREPAVDGKATTAAAKLLAEYYGVSKSAVKLLHGASSRHKVFEVQS